MTSTHNGRSSLAYICTNKNNRSEKTATSQLHLKKLCHIIPSVLLRFNTVSRRKAGMNSVPLNIFSILTELISHFVQARYHVHWKEDKGQSGALSEPCLRLDT